MSTLRTLRRSKKFTAAKTKARIIERGLTPMPTELLFYVDAAMRREMIRLDGAWWTTSENIQALRTIHACNLVIADVFGSINWWKT